VDVTCLTWGAPNVKESHEIGKVTMDATEDLYWRFNFSDHNWLDCKNVDALSSELNNVFSLKGELRTLWWEFEILRLQETFKE